MSDTPICITNINTPPPRYVDVRKQHHDVAIVEIGMVDRYGVIDAICNTGLNGDGLEIFFSVEGDEAIQRSFVFPTYRGWDVASASYTSYTMLVVLAKGLWE